MYAWTYAMGLKAMSALFGMLPAEVLEEEVSRAREILLKVSIAKTLLLLCSLTLLRPGHEFYARQRPSDRRHGHRQSASDHTGRYQTL